MTYKMTPEYQKILMEMLGEEIKPDTEYHCHGTIRETGESCNCHNFIDGMRDFTTDSDKDKVFRWLVDNGKWGDFYFYSTIAYKSIVDKTTYISWLFYDSERFNVLVAMALEENVI